MSALVRAEARKIWSSPTTWWLLVITAAVGVLGTLAPLLADGERADVLSDDSLQSAMHGAAAGSILVIVLGIVGTAGEWRFGQITQTLLTTPRRRHVLTAKSAVHLAAGAAFGIVAATASLVTATSWYAAEGHSLPVTRSAVWLTLLGCVAVAALYGVLGVAVGAIARNPITAIVGALAWLALVEPALFAAAPRVFRWLPGIAAFGLERQPTEHLLAPAPAAGVLLAAVSALWFAGQRLVEHDDVTA
jgi:hypothetical protein